MNELFKALYVSMGNPEEAFLRNPNFTESEYEAAATSAEYQEFLQEINNRFVAHLDQLLIYQQYEAFKLLEEIKAGKRDLKYLKDASQHWLQTLKLTTPVVERLGAQIRQEEQLAGLRLIISPPSDTQ